MELLKEVIADISPSAEDKKKVEGIVKDILEKINRNFKEGKAILGGSGAKGTNLKTFDVDIFAKFNYGKYADKSDFLADILEKRLKKCFGRIARLHGSRDYFQIRAKKFTVEIIPILDVRNAKMAKNITDMSPLHAEWVLKHKKLRDEIRLAKQFCKAAGAYGAESYLQVFSGYVCEILTIHYGGFLKLIKAAAKWKPKQIIDIKGYYKGKDVFKEMNTSKLTSPLIVIDPIQKDRNAAAALSDEKFNAFVDAAKNFLKKPSKSYFIARNILDEPRENALALRISPVEGKPDVVGSKLLKCVEEIARIIEKNEFTITRKRWDWDRKGDAIAVFRLKESSLPKTKKISGPPVEQKIHVERFKKKYKSTFRGGEKIFANIKRKVADRKDLFKIIKQDSFIRERCKNIEIIK